MIIVDTNVISEMMKPEPDSSVARWAERESRSKFYTTTVTLAEVRFGIEILPRGKRRTSLEAAADAVLSEFGNRLLPFDAQAAEEYGRLVAARQRAGKIMPVLDAQIAAIALAHSATLATRNVRDFEGCGVDLVNPWE